LKAHEAGDQDRAIEELKALETASSEVVSLLEEVSKHLSAGETKTDRRQSNRTPVVGDTIVLTSGDERREVKLRLFNLVSEYSSRLLEPFVHRPYGFHGAHVWRIRH
jgi:hypothetical protein